jgi:hypothetical protein
MRILNARAEKAETIPFSLGEDGRARKRVPVVVSPRNAPESGDVGYIVASGGVVVLTKPQPNQRGVLVHIDTKGCYTRGTQGATKLLGGEATCIASGTYAYGNAGGIGGGSDELWHVSSSIAMWGVVISGGAYKGFGHRYCVLNKSGNIRMITRQKLCQLITTDDEPEIVEVAREFANVLHKDVQDAFALAEQLADFDPHSNAVQHYLQVGYRERLETIFEIAIPIEMATLTCGVSGIQASTLVPGNKALVAFNAGPGGRKRHAWKEIDPHHVTILESKWGSNYTDKEYLALVEEPDWYFAWSSTKDGQLTGYSFVDAHGIYNYDADGQHCYSTAWEGIPAGQAPAWSQIAPIFGVDLPEPEPKPNMATVVSGNEDEEADQTPLTLEGLQARFNRNRLK